MPSHRFWERFVETYGVTEHEQMKVIEKMFNDKSADEILETSQKTLDQVAT